MDIRKRTKKHPVLRWKSKPPTEYCCLSCASFPNSMTPANSLAWWLLLLLVFSVTNVSAAADSNVLIVKSGSASVYNRIVSATRQRINRICPETSDKCSRPSLSIETIRNKKLRSIARNKKWDLIVTIGTKAAKRINSYGIQTPTLYSLIPSRSYPGIKSKSKSRQKSAIYIDQPIKRQLQLIKSAMPERKSVGVLLGRYSSIGKKRLQQIMRGMGLKPTVGHATPENIGTRIEDIYPKIKVLLALPDPTVYNKNTVLKVLLSSYRHRVPVIGYSAAFVKSGATAAIYSTPRNIGYHIGDEVGKFLFKSKGRLSSPAYPRYFTVNTNKSVVNSLHIKMPSSSTIKSRMNKANR